MFIPEKVSKVFTHLLISADPGLCKGERAREETVVAAATTTTTATTATAATTATLWRSDNSDSLAGGLSGSPLHRSRTSIHRLRGFCFTGGGSFPESLRSTWGSLGCPLAKIVSSFSTGFRSYVRHFLGAIFVLLRPSVPCCFPVRQPFFELQQQQEQKQ